MATFVIMRELEPSEHIGTEERKDHNPEREEDLAVENVPTIGHIGNGEELESESQLDEAESHLDDIHPSTGTGRTLEERREESEERERDGKSQGETEHSDSWGKDAALGSNGYEKETDDRTRAGEGDEGESERHEENGEKPCGIAFAGLNLIGPRGGESYLERAEERGGEDEEEEAEENVENSIRRKCVKLGSSPQTRNDETEGQVDYDNGSTIGESLGNGLLSLLVAFEEEADSQWNYWPYAWGEDGDETAEETLEKDLPEGKRIGIGEGLALRFHLLDRGSPSAGREDIGWDCSGRLDGGGIGIGGRDWLLLCCGLDAGGSEIYVGWGEAALVVAGSVFECHVDGVGTAREADVLYESYVALEIAQLHAEHLVLLLDLVTTCDEGSVEFGPLDAIDNERGAYRAFVAEIGGVDVPTTVDRAFEYDIDLAWVRGLLHTGGEMDRLGHLRHGGERDGEEGEK